MRRGRKNEEIRIFEISELVLIVVAVAIVLFTVWFVGHSKRIADQAYNNPAQAVQVNPGKHTPNLVADPQNGSDDLVTFLRTNDTGCWRSPSQGTGWYRVVKEVNGDQADVEYGCSRTYDQGTGTPARILAHKVNGKWGLISPTDQWRYNLPSCSMVKANGILATLEPGCWTKEAAGAVTVVPNTISQYAGSYATCAVAPGSIVTKSPAICVTKDRVVFTK